MDNQEKHDLKFIEEMKVKLNEERDALLKDLAGVADKRHGDYRAKHEDFGRDEDENAAEEAEYLARHGATEVVEERLESVERALKRVKDGKYGFTDKGVKIREERLRANPAAESE